MRVASVVDHPFAVSGKDLDRTGMCILLPYSSLEVRA
jgi:hypothetical protein